MQRKILVVEDNAVNQKLAVRLLQKLGHAPDVALNGAEAFPNIQQTLYDLVLMDLQMPVMGGLEATQKIRELERDPDRHPHPCHDRSCCSSGRKALLGRRHGRLSHQARPQRNSAASHRAFHPPISHRARLPFPSRSPFFHARALYAAKFVCRNCVGLALPSAHHDPLDSSQADLTPTLTS